MKKKLAIILLITIVGSRNMESQTTNNSQTKAKRASLAELYKLADSINKARNKGKATTMWIDDLPISNERYRLESKTMWIEDSTIHMQKNFTKKERGFTRKK